MFLYNLRRRLRHKRIDRLMQHSGHNYRRHQFEIVVSENELLIQLQECAIHTNLLNLLVYGAALPDYETRLMRAALKFEFLGSLVHPISKNETAKPKPTVYVCELFRGFYETADEVRCHIERMTAAPVSTQYAQQIFHKLVFIINTCCPLMADPCERWYEETYRLFIEYAIEHDDFDFPNAENIRRAFPKDLPLQGSVRSHLLKKMPREFTEKVTRADLDHNSIRR